MTFADCGRFAPRMMNRVKNRNVVVRGSERRLWQQALQQFRRRGHRSQMRIS